MGIVFRQAIKSTIIIATGAVLGALINYTYSFAFTKQQFGFARTLTSQAVIFHVFFIWGLGSTLLNFSPRYGEKDERRKLLISLSFIAPLITVVLFSIPYFLLRDEILQLYAPEDRSMANSFYAVVPVFIFLWSNFAGLEYYLVSQSKTAIMSFMREIVLRVLNFVLIGLFYFGIISFPQFVYGFVGSHLVGLALIFLAAKRTKDFGFSFKWNLYSKAEYKEIINYSWYHMLVSSTLYLLGYVDGLMLGSRLSGEGLSSVAVYTIAIFIISIMVIPYRAMSSSSIPTLNRAYLSGDHDELADIFHRSGINIFIAAVAMFVLIACNLDNAVAILPPDYAELKPIVLILMIGRMADMATGLNTELTSISKYYKFNFRISILLLVMLAGLCYLLIPAYGASGAAWASTIALALFNMGKMAFLWWKMKLQPFTNRSALVLLAGLITFAAGYFLPYIFNPILDTIVRSSVVIAIYAGLLIWLKPSEDLNTYMAAVKANKRLF